HGVGRRRLRMAAAPSRPADRLGAALHALREPAALHRARLPLLALAERHGQRIRIAGADAALQTEAQRIETERERDLVHVRLEGEVALWATVTAEGAGYGPIRVRHV